MDHYENLKFIILSSVACLVLPYFSTLSHTWHDFWKKMIVCKTYVVILSITLCEKNSHSKNNLTRYYHESFHVKYLLFLTDFNES